jgi:hypothetical protein
MKAHPPAVRGRIAELTVSEKRRAMFSGDKTT